MGWIEMARAMDIDAGQLDRDSCGRGQNWSGVRHVNKPRPCCGGSRLGRHCANAISKRYRSRIHRTVCKSLNVWVEFIENLFRERKLCASLTRKHCDVDISRNLVFLSIYAAPVTQLLDDPKTSPDGQCRFKRKASSKKRAHGVLRRLRMGNWQ